MPAIRNLGHKFTILVVAFLAVQTGSPALSMQDDQSVEVRAIKDTLSSELIQYVARNSKPMQYHPENAAYIPTSRTFRDLITEQCGTFWISHFQVFLEMNDLAADEIKPDDMIGKLASEYIWPSCLYARNREESPIVYEVKREGTTLGEVKQLFTGRAGDGDKLSYFVEFENRNSRSFNQIYPGDKLLIKYETLPVRLQPEDGNLDAFLDGLFNAAAANAKYPSFWPAKDRAVDEIVFRSLPETRRKSVIPATLRDVTGSVPTFDGILEIPDLPGQAPDTPCVIIPCSADRFLFIWGRPNDIQFTEFEELSGMQAPSYDRYASEMSITNSFSPRETGNSLIVTDGTSASGDTFYHRPYSNSTVKKLNEVLFYNDNQECSPFTDNSQLGNAALVARLFELTKDRSRQLSIIDVLIVDNGFQGVPPCKKGEDCPARDDHGNLIMPDIFSSTFFRTDWPDGIIGPSLFGRYYPIIYHSYTLPNKSPLPPDSLERSHGTHVTGLALGGPAFLPFREVLFNEQKKSLIKISIVNAADGQKTLDNILTSTLDAQVERSSPIVVNLSLDLVVRDNVDVNQLRRDIEYRDRIVLYIVAAGNHGLDFSEQSRFPGKFGGTDIRNLVSVGAIDADGAILNDSNRSEQYVDILSPGCGIASWLNDKASSIGKIRGTSMAAPITTFAAALIYATADRKLPEDIKNRIMFSGTLLEEKYWKTNYSRSQLNIPYSVMTNYDVLEILDENAGLPDGQVSKTALIGDITFEFTDLRCEQNNQPIKSTEMRSLKRIPNTDKAVAYYILKVDSKPIVKTCTVSPASLRRYGSNMITVKNIAGRIVNNVFYPESNALLKKEEIPLERVVNFISDGF